MDLELRKKWLLQQKELYGNSLYIEQFNKNSFLTESNIENDNFLTNCSNCSMDTQKSSLIFGIGNPDADFVFISETSNKLENLTNEILNEADKLFENILSAINLNKKDIYHIYVLKCTNEISHFKQCNVFLKSQIKSINPKVIIGLGSKSSHLIPNINLSMEKMRDKLFNYDGFDFKVTYHPEDLLEDSKLKRPTWEDFKKIKTNYLLESKS